MEQSQGAIKDNKPQHPARSHSSRLHSNNAANGVTDKKSGLTDDVLAEVDNLLTPGFECVGERFAGDWFRRLAIANQVNGIDPVGLAEVRQVFAPVVAVGSKTMDQEQRWAIGTCGLVANGEALPGPEVGLG